MKKSFPVNKDSVAILIADYKNFIKQYPDNANALEASKNQALLYANYLDQKDSAIQILNKLIANPKSITISKVKSEA